MFALNSYYKGLIYEFFSVLFLFFRGHKILRWRYKSSVGEIDIISKKRGVIFVHEVKYRRELEQIYHLVNNQYQARLERTYYWWLQNNQQYNSYELRIEYIFWHKRFRMKRIWHGI